MSLKSYILGVAIWGHILWSKVLNFESGLLGPHKCYYTALYRKWPFGTMYVSLYGYVLRVAVWGHINVSKELYIRSGHLGPQEVV